MNILIVDDDKSIRDFSAAIADSLGLNSFQAGSLKEALWQFQKEAIDIVLIDVYLPDGTGFELSSKLRDLSKDKWIPIIFVSASDTDEDIEKSVIVGGDDYLIKPIRPVVMTAKLQTMSRIALMQQKMDKANLRLKELSIQDPLTKLYNRRHLYGEVIREWREHNRSTQEFSMLIVDIDNFKALNDRLGHLHGDACLQKIAQILYSSCSRPRDICARYGGEEFVAILPNTSLEGATNIAEEIRKCAEDIKIAHPCSPVADYVTVSIGVSSSRLNADTPTALFEQADKALYLSKASGKNQVTSYEDYLKNNGNEFAYA